MMIQKDYALFRPLKEAEGEYRRQHRREERLELAAADKDEVSLIK